MTARGEAELYRRALLAIFEAQDSGSFVALDKAIANARIDVAQIEYYWEIASRLPRSGKRFEKKAVIRPLRQVVPEEGE